MNQWDLNLNKKNMVSVGGIVSGFKQDAMAVLSFGSPFLSPS